VTQAVSNRQTSTCIDQKGFVDTTRAEWADLQPFKLLLVQRGRAFFRDVVRFADTFLLYHERVC
jgi:hypothetical protein